MEGRGYLEDLSVYVIKILIWILKQRIAFIWLWIGSSCGLLWTRICTNLRVPYKAGNSFARWVTISFSTRTLLHMLVLSHYEQFHTYI